MGYTLLSVALGGSLGALARYGLGGFIQRHCGSGFPWGTFGVNVLGCLFFGALWSYSSEHLSLSGTARTFLLTGFMGAFTTFSTFISETGQLLTEGELFFAFLNLGGQILLGLGALFCGIILGRLL